jgi:nucleoside-diphosphate-sugar epimerase
METWATLMGKPLLETGRTRIFGRGNNPINFVSAHDVARFIELAVVDPTMRCELVEVGGPENLSMNKFAKTFEAVTGKAGKVSHVPLPMMRLMAVLMRPVNPTLARQVQAGVVMDTHDMSFDPSDTDRRNPSIPLTSLAEVVRRDYAG